jgi:hypothetical protein
LSQVLGCQAAFEAALKRLQRGERRCFVFLGASGHFYQGTLATLWWKEMDDRERHMGGAQFSPNQSPLWPEIEKALNDFLDVYYDIAVVLQDRFTDVPAPIANLDDIEPAFWAKLVQRVPADPAKARVPAPPKPTVIVKTKNTIPEYGVWEPVVKVSKDVYQIDGAMNYLHGGQLAPTIAFAGDGPRREGRSTLWRLIWADHRYEDGRIPDDEKTYEFGGTMSA